MTKKHFNYSRVGILVAFAVAFSAITAGVALAEYPDKPITFIVPYSPGGGSDQQARRLQPGLEKALGVKIRIVYKTGGGGAVGFNELWRSKPDGYTISNVVVPNIVISAKGKDVGFKPGEFAYIGMTARAQGCIMVPKGSPYKTIDQFVAAAKANPGGLTISTSGTGGVWHELALIIANAAGIELKYVPYKGGQPATLAGLQGETDIAGGGLHEHIDLIRSGELRNLLQTTGKDITLDDGTMLPTLGTAIPSASGTPVGATYNFMVKRDLPPEVLQEIADAFVAAATSAGFLEMLESKFFISDVKIGEEADREGALMEAITTEVFNKYKDQIGAEVKTAAELGLPAPADFDTWWPPEGYVAPPIKANS